MLYVCFFFSFPFVSVQSQGSDRGGALHLWWMSCVSEEDNTVGILPHTSPCTLSALVFYASFFRSIWVVLLHTMWISAWWMRKNKRDLCFLVLYLFKVDFVLLPLQRTVYFFHLFVWHDFWGALHCLNIVFSNYLVAKEEGKYCGDFMSRFPWSLSSFSISDLILVYMRCPALCG